VVVATVALFSLVAWLIYGRPFPVWTVIRNALLLDASINGAFWSLQMEVWGSLLVIFCFLAERRLGLWIVWALAVGLGASSFLRFALSGAYQNGMYYTFLAGYLVAATPRPALKLPPAVAWIVLAVALVAFYWAHHRGPVVKQWLLLLTTISSALIVLVFSTRGFRNVLQQPALAWLGTISYSFYAVHGLGVDMAQSAAGWLAPVRLPHAAVVAALFLVAALASVLITIPMHYLVERNGLALGAWLKRILGLMRQPRAAVTSVARS